MILSHKLILTWLMVLTYSAVHFCGMVLPAAYCSCPILLSCIFCWDGKKYNVEKRKLNPM